MFRIIAARLAHAAAVLVIVTLATTAMLSLAPGDPAASILGQNATADQIAAVHHQLGLDRPFIEQYLSWAKDALHGDLGTSFLTHQSVWSAIAQTLPVTLEITLLGLGMALLVALPLGVLSAYKAGGNLDRVSSSLGSVLISSPSFLTGLVLAYVLAVRLEIFPVTGWVKFTTDPVGNIEHAFLPALTLCLGVVAVFSRILRSDVITTLNEDYVLSAYSKGIRVRRVLLGHALRPSLFSLVTLTSLSLGQLMGGAVIVESLFALPGVGSLLILSITGKDIVMVQGIVVVIAVGYVVINSIADVIYLVLDPRVRTHASVPA